MSGDLFTPGEVLALVRDSWLAGVSLDTAAPRYELVSARAPQQATRDATHAAQEVVVSM